jgi:hypothetical protein
MSYPKHDCINERKCRLLIEALEECDVPSARELLWHAAEEMGWEPDELIGVDVDEMT